MSFQISSLSIKNYYQKSLYLFEAIDGPCIVHRDFRPGNIIIKNDAVSGVIDWSSARIGFAEEDFCSIEHDEWGDFNGNKNFFLEGYSTIRSMPSYHNIMPFLRLNRAIGIVGFLLKIGLFEVTHASLYQYNKTFIESFDFNEHELQ